MPCLIDTLRIMWCIVALGCGGEPKGVGTPTAKPETPQRECFCFSWVHLDENGESCFETKDKCDTEFAAFGRDMKIPCEPSQRATCGSHACRDIGKECVKL